MFYEIQFHLDGSLVEFQPLENYLKVDFLIEADLLAFGFVTVT